ncbi:MAG TPA: cytochrome P450, partial [Mycobacteriales bacterium]|nr:cytochrome P450 [Mycobacteriales bacterium]
WEAARRLDDIVITRVAVEPQLIGGRQIRAGDRVLVDVPAANADVPALPDPHSVLPDPRVDHLSFGAGEHACMGRELALAVATAGLSGLLGRGVPQPADGVGGLRLLPRSGSTT